MSVALTGLRVVDEATVFALVLTVPSLSPSASLATGAEATLAFFEGD